MAVQQQIQKDMIQSMKNKDVKLTSLLRVVIGEFNRVGKDLSDDESLKVIRKMHVNATELGNTDEVDILDKYLPKMYTPEVLETIISDIITLNKYSTIKDMGKVMTDLKNLPTSNLIDGKLSSMIVRKILN